MMEYGFKINAENLNEIDHCTTPVEDLDKFWAKAKLENNARLESIEFAKPLNNRSQLADWPFYSRISLK
jgi:hypothetical protein